MRRCVFLSLILIPLFYCACNSGPHIPTETNKEEGPSYDLEMHQKSITIQLEKQLQDSQGRYFQYLDTLKSFYKERSNNPIWTAIYTEDSVLNEWLSFIQKDVFEEGLLPQWYALDSMILEIQELSTIDSWDYQKMATLDVKLSLTMLALHADHVIGRSTGQRSFGRTYRLPKRASKLDWLAILDPVDYKKVFLKSGIQHPHYLSYKKLLKSLQKAWEKEEYNWEPIPFGKLKKLSPKDTIEIMPQIAKRLVQLGFADKKALQVADSWSYNKGFVPFVKAFQDSLSLTPDGVIGRKTMEMLNTTPSFWYAEIAANMERLRWFIPDSTQKKIMVNLADFTLELDYVDSSKNMVVCIGKARSHLYDDQYQKYLNEEEGAFKPKHHETPQIYSNFSYLVINPTWTVPKSIIRREMWYRMKRDPTYLRRNRFEVYKGKTKMNADSINWSKINPYRNPYRIVQKKGARNALGKVKYIFPNPYSIYLHDTPLKSKFKLTARAVSHGCVRLGEPDLVAEFLLQDHPKVSYDDYRIKLGMLPLDEERLEEYDPEDSTALVQPIDSTEIVYIKKRIPVYFDYKTVFFKSNQAFLRYDVYGSNRRLLAHLATAPARRWW
jgi:murein L,D-transpeptidase YcbB/YkuD